MEASKLAGDLETNLLDDEDANETRKEKEVGKAIWDLHKGIEEATKALAGHSWGMATPFAL